MGRCTSNSLDGHKFEPRYDSEPPTPTQMSTFEAVGLNAVKSLTATLTRRTYIKDICVSCGLSVEREHVGPPDKPPLMAI